MSGSKMQCLRVYASETKRLGRRPLYEAIVSRAMKLGLAGATVTRGVMGYGRSRRIRTTKILVLFDHMPVVVEIVDTADRLQTLLDDLKPHEPDALFTLHDITTIDMRPASPGDDSDH